MQAPIAYSFSLVSLLHHTRPRSQLQTDNNLKILIYTWGSQHLLHPKQKQSHSVTVVELRAFAHT